MALKAGDRVFQSAYGVGDVTDVSADRVTIAFDDGGVRKFITSMARLEPSDAPRERRVKPKRSRRAPTVGGSTKGSPS